MSIRLEADDHATLPRPLPGQYLTRENSRCRRTGAAAQLLAFG